MYKSGLNYTWKSFSVCSVKGRIFCGFILILFCFLTVRPIFGEVTNSSQLIDISRETLPNQKVVKIEYRIDELPVTNNEILSKLKKLTYIAVGSLFSRYAVQRSVISLYSLQEFSQVDVYTVETHEGIVLTFDLINMMHIHKIVLAGKLSDELDRAIRAVIRLEPGTLYVPVVAKNYVTSIKAVCADNGYFDANIEFSAAPDDGSLTYQIDLGNPTHVSEFQIQGNSAIFSEQIKEICQTQTGKVYRKSAVDEDIAAIRDLYRKKYYPSAKIKPDFAYKTGVLTYVIDEGVQLLLDFVDKNGKPILRDTPIRNFLAKLGIIRHKSEKNQLRNRITSLIDNQFQWEHTVRTHFEAKGYHGTEVALKKLTNSPLHVKFTINPGTRYVVTRLTFAGNDAFSDKELLREMDTKPSNPLSRLIWRRVFSEQTLLRDIQRLGIFYEQAGYPDMDVKTPELDKSTFKNRSVGEVSIHLTIVENQKEVINRCEFNGHRALDATTLFDALPSKLPQPNAPLARKNYENAILKAYRERGYMDAKLVNPPQYIHKMDTSVFRVEGNFTEQLDAGTLPKKLRDAFKKHGFSLAGIFIATATKIGEEWNMQDADGNARYTLKQEQEFLSVFEHGVLQFEIEEGEQITFGKFFFVGDTGVKQHILYREVAHLEGTLYTPDKLRRSIENLYSTGIFEPGIRARRTPTDDVSIQLQKRKPRVVGASVGYSSSDGPRGTIALSHHNLFKRNIRFRLRGRQGTLGYLYDTTLTEPWLIGRTSGSLQFLGRKLEEDDNVRALQGIFSLSRKLPGAHRLNLEYSYRYLKDTSEILSITTPSTTVSSLRFLWRQDSLFPSLNPVSGMFNEVTVEYAGGFLGGKSSFVKTTADIIYPQRLNKRGLVLATALRLGFTTGIFADREAELISFERFWAGGSTTVRGYEERGLGPEDSTKKHRGNVKFIFNTELRFPIYTPIDGVLFFDTGNVWGTIEDIEYKWMPSSVGVGLRLNLGPLIGGIDYAVPLISVTDVPIDTFYFRIGSTF